jgi:PLP dependent protein
MALLAPFDVAAALAGVRERVVAACARAGREESSVCLLGASKVQPDERVRTAVEAGLTDLGENYVQGLLARLEAFKGSPLRWHLIGALQRRKARKVVGSVALIHSVDRLELATEIDLRARALGVVQEVLLEVSIAGEETKAGANPETLPALFDSVQELAGVRVRGLMSIPPHSENPELLRSYYTRTRELLEGLRERCPERKGFLVELSMGMSNDLEVAIGEGATIIRVGSALFGPRPPRT